MRCLQLQLFAAQCAVDLFLLSGCPCSSGAGRCRIRRQAGRIPSLLRVHISRSAMFTSRLPLYSSMLNWIINYSVTSWSFYFVSDNLYLIVITVIILITIVVIVIIIWQLQLPLCAQCVVDLFPLYRYNTTTIIQRNCNCANLCSKCQSIYIRKCDVLRKCGRIKLLANSGWSYEKTSIFTRLMPRELEEFYRSHADLSL